jgi:hypothetical protein
VSCHCVAAASERRKSGGGQQMGGAWGLLKLDGHDDDVIFRPWRSMYLMLLVGLLNL